MNRPLVFFFLLILCFPGFGQINNFRIKSDFSIKEKVADGKFNLIMGKVYYDLNYDKIVYDNSFPVKETLVYKDTLIYHFKEGQFVKKYRNYMPNKFSIFYLSLSGSIHNYGLQNTFYKKTAVEKENDMVVTTWLPETKFAKQFGKVLTSTKNKKLFGVVIYDTKGEIISKQFYKNYIVINGLEFPGEIVQLYYKSGKELYQVTTYKNVVVNELQDDHIYNYSVKH